MAMLDCFSPVALGNNKFVSFDNCDDIEEAPLMSFVFYPCDPLGSRDLTTFFPGIERFSRSMHRLMLERFVHYSSTGSLSGTLTVASFQKSVRIWLIPQMTTRIVLRWLEHHNGNELNAPTYVSILSVLLKGGFDEKLSFCVQLWTQTGTLRDMLVSFLTFRHTNASATRRADVFLAGLHEQQQQVCGRDTCAAFVKSVHMIPALKRILAQGLGDKALY
eukprot:TRINITY_DN907_c0_g1_i1.p2 TRINITY_DN907_c0_g1~~TRINITY_DN907_c0_g1_i1.p2  ORF type:complete len:219 (-),score=30.71 TRINITY_DN907_c0_g1_i1:3010-3666(-)